MAEREPGDEGLAARLSSAMGTGDPEGRKPVSLTEALYSRIVEVTREEVSQTTEVLGEVIVQLGRLERRVTALTTSLEGGTGAPGSATVAPDFSELTDRLGRLESLLAGVETRLATSGPSTGTAPAAEIDLAPIDTRLQDLAETVQLMTMRVEELANRPAPEPAAPAGDPTAVTQTITRGLSEVRTALLTAQPDLSPVLRSLEELRGAIAQVSETASTATSADAPAQVDLGPVLEKLDALYAKPEPGPVDLTPVTEVTAQWLAEVRSTVTGNLDELRKAMERGPSANRVEEALSSGLAALQGTQQANHAMTEAKVAELRQTVDEALTGLRADIERSAEAARSAAPQVDLEPITAAIADLRSSLPAPVDLSPLASSLDEMRQAPPPAPPDLSPVTGAVGELQSTLSGQLDQLAQAITAASDTSQLVDAVNANVTNAVRAAVSGGNEDLAARLDDVRAAVAATGARFTAKMEELRNGLADDTEGLADRIDAVAERASRPVDLDPVITAVQQGLGDVRDAMPAPAEPVDLAPIRADIEAAVTALRDAMPAPAEPVDLTPIRADIGQLRGDLAAWRDATPPPPDLEPVVGAVRDVQSSLDQHRDAILERLAAFAQGDDLLAEVRGLLTQLSEDMQGVRANNDPAALLQTFDEGTSRAVERLSQASEGMLARMDRRDAQMASLKVDLEQAVERSLRGLATDVAGVREGVASSDRVARQRFSELELAMTDLRGEVGMVRTLREAIDRMASGVEGVKTLVQQADRGPEMQRVASSLSDVTRDITATRERVVELDHSVAGLRTELSGTAEVAQASYQTADTLGALIPAVSSLENRIAAEVDDLGRRIDSLASALQSTVAALPAPRARGATQEKVATEVGDRLTALREVAAGVSEAVRNDLKKRRKHRAAIGSGAHRDGE